MRTKIFIVLMILAGLSPVSFNFGKNGVSAQTAPVLQNDKLPEFIEWAKTYDIKLIGTKRSGQYIENNIWNSATDEIPLTAIDGINSVFEDLKKIPSHLINTLRGNAIFFSSGSGNCVDRAGFFLYQTELSQKYQKKPSELPQEAREEGRRTYISAGILPYMGNDGFYIRPYDIFLCMSGAATIHEFGHIVDLNGIRMFNGRETAIGKTDEETRQLYAEYERIFGVNKLSPEIRRQWQNSTSTMPGILNNYGLNGDDENFAVSFDYYVSRAQYFRDKAVQDPGVAEKYEFLKNKIFLGKEYSEEKSVVATPTQTSSAQVEALKTQIQVLQDQIVKLRVQLNEIQKTEISATKNIIFTKTLQRGMKDDEVKQLQEFLKQYPEIYPERLVTGYFGSLTERAVKRFQEKYGIESIGIVGPKTRAKLNELYSVQSSPPVKETKLEEKKEVVLTLPLLPPSIPVPPSTSTTTATSTQTLTPTPTPTPTSTPTSTPIPAPAPILDLTCADGSPNNTCASVKPFMCRDGQLIAASGICGCGNGQPLQNGECNSKCLPVQYSGDPAAKLDIVFVPDNLNSQQVIDFVARITPIMAGVKGEFGILNRKPFVSSREKVNVWALAVSENFKCNRPWCHAEPSANWTEEEREGHAKLMAALDTCPGRDQVVIVPSQTKSARAGDSVIGSGYAYVLYAPTNANYMAAIATHEFAHSFGLLTDEYTLGFSSYLSEDNLQYNIKKGIKNCDQAGCPQWCSGTSAMSYEEYAPECIAFTSKETCEAAASCAWLPKFAPDYPENVNSYYTSPCVAKAKDINNGTNCLANTGCFQGCGGGVFNWWRSAAKSIMTSDLYLEFSGWHIKLLQEKLEKFR